MARLLGILFCYLATGCALSPPEGIRELMQDIDHDRNEKRREVGVSFEGKPMFVKVRVYPKINEGNIFGKQWILLQIGREKVDLDKLMNDIEEN